MNDKDLENRLDNLERKIDGILSILEESTQDLSLISETQEDILERINNLNVDDPYDT